MQPVFAFSATLVPRPGDSDVACFDRVAAAVAAWATKEGGRAVRERADAATEVVSATTQTRTDGGEYESVCAAGRTRLGVQAVVTVRGAGPDGATPEPVCPAVLNRILDCAEAVIGGRPVPRRVTRADRGGAGAVADLVLDPARALPVVVLSPHPDTGRPLADPDAVMDELFGLAHVAELLNRDATFALTDRVGKEWSCFHGAARVYWPGVDLAESPYRHPLFFPAHYAGPDGGERLVAELFRRVARAGAGRAADAPLVRQARAAVDAARRAEADARLAALSAGAAQAEELRVALAGAAAERQKLVDDRDFLRLQVDDLERRLAEEREQWRTVALEIAAAKADADRHKRAAGRYRDRVIEGLRTVRDVVALARDEFADTLTFLPSAEDSAARSQYHHRRKLFDLFAALDEVGHDLAARGSLGESLFDALRRRGFEYKPHVSQTSVGKFGAEYTFVYRGQKLLFDHHVTLGSSHDPQACLSVHWVRDDAAGKFVVGHCGKHLTNLQT